MVDDNKHLERERKTLGAMINMYCRAHHGGGKELCEVCSELRDYANARLDKCKFADDKPTCEKCPVHCYKPAMRERVRKVMRYSGPRMLAEHPILAIHHLKKSRKKVELKKDKKEG